MAFNNLSVISRRCLDVAGSSMLTFRVRCLTEISHPRYLTGYSTQSHYTDIELTSSDSYLYFLNAERQAKEQLVPYLKSLV